MCTKRHRLIQFFAISFRTVSSTQLKYPASDSLCSWDGLSNKLCQQLRSRFLRNKNADGVGDSALATVCVCRNSCKSSKSTKKQEIDIAKIATKLKNTQNCVDWNPFPVDIWMGEGKSTKNMNRSLTLCSNLSSFGTSHCQKLLKSAWIKYKAKAYLHWYERYGTTEADFTQAFEVVENIVDEYKTATTS